MNCDNCGIECTDENKCNCSPDSTHCKEHHPGGDAAPAGEDAGEDKA